MNTQEILINVDAGETRAGSSVDLELLTLVDAINIALGGHAGETGWSRELADLAVATGKRVHLHPGYPDRGGFGRRHMEIRWDDLCRSLDEQRAVLPEITTCKFHGAIYNEACVDQLFAEKLVEWCQRSGVQQLLAPESSCLALAATGYGIDVLREGFVDRRYVLECGRLTLQNRSQPGAVIDSVDEVLAQTTSITASGRVTLVDGHTHAIQCDTLCFHSDSDGAVEVARALRAWKSAE